MSTFTGTYGSTAMLASVAIHLDADVPDNVDIHTITLELDGRHGEFTLVVLGSDEDMEEVRFEGIAHRSGGVQASSASTRNLASSTPHQGDHVKKILVILALLFAGVFFAPSAQASEQTDTMTVVWEMPSWQNSQTPTWPQSYVSSSKNAGLDVSTPECGYFQVDEYRYATERDRANVDKLIAGGVLNGPSNPTPEPLIRWKLVNGGVCESETPTPTPTETTPTPTPTESTATPTPTESTQSPTPTPTKSTSTPKPSKSTAPPSDTPDSLPKTGFPLLPVAALGLLSIVGGRMLMKKGKHA